MARQRSAAGDGAGVDTMRAARRILVVVRSLATLSRLRDALAAVYSDRRLSITFAIDRGSRFSGDLADRLHDDKLDVIRWEQARETDWDLILAAHVNGNLAELRGPVVVFPPGAGYGRPLADAPGTAFPAAIGLSHEDQARQLPTGLAARARTFVMGDPTFDRMVANRPRRADFRRLLGAGDRRVVVVSSTWSRHSTVAFGPELVNRLLAQLPADEWLVVAILHPNIWFEAGSGWELANSLFADALDSGLVLISPDNGWQVAVLAADVLAGDHGSVTFYGAALGIPFLLTPAGLDEPAPPRILLHRAAPRLDADGDLRGQLAAAIAKHDPNRIRAITDLTFGRQRQALDLLRAQCYELLRLKPPRAASRIRPLPEPILRRGAEPTAYLVAATVAATGVDSGTVRLERFPAIVADYRRPEPPLDLFEVIYDTEVDFRHRQSAEIVVRRQPLREDDAVRWITRIRDECPGAALVAVRTGTQCLLRWQSRRWQQAVVALDGGGEPAGPDALLAATAVYGWFAAGREMPDSGISLRVRVGRTESTIKARPAASPLP